MTFTFIYNTENLALKYIWKHIKTFPYPPNSLLLGSYNIGPQLHQTTSKISQTEWSASSWVELTTGSLPFTEYHWIGRKPIYNQCTRRAKTKGKQETTDPLVISVAPENCLKGSSTALIRHLDSNRVLASTQTGYYYTCSSSYIMVSPLSLD